jgi:hypothetical protein
MKINNWLNYINEWYKYNDIIFLKSSLWYIKSLILNLEKSVNKNIKNILENKDNINLILQPYNFKNNYILIKQINKIILKQLNFNLEFYIDTDFILSTKINYKYIILYYLYYCDSKIIEKIHWSYFRIDFIIIMIKLNISIKKIIEILNWNLIYNFDITKNFLIEYSTYINKIYISKNNFCINMNIIKDYIAKLDIGFNYFGTNNILNLSNTHNNIITNIENKKIFNIKINISDPKIIKNLIQKNDDNIFNKLLNKIDKQILINNIISVLTKSNIKEKNILKNIKLFEKDNKNNLLFKNNKLFCKLLSSGYIYCINKIWNKNIPTLNNRIYITLKRIILNDDEKIFEILLKSNILDKYLLNKMSIYINNIWTFILFNTTKIPIILLKYNYIIPKYTILTICSKFNPFIINKNWSKINYINTFNLNKYYSNFILNLKIFNIPLNENLFQIFFRYMSNENIIKYINENIININLILSLILNFKKFSLLEILFNNINKNIFNKEIYKKNINSYIKNIKNINTISLIYIYNIKNLDFKIINKYIIFALKNKKYNLVNVIFKKQINCINYNHIIKYLFNEKYINKFDKYYNNKYYNNKYKDIYKDIYKNIFKIYSFLNNNIKNWNKIYENNFVCKIILEKSNFTFEDYLKIININKNFNLNFNKFFKNNLINFKLKKKILTHYKNTDKFNLSTKNL